MTVARRPRIAITSGRTDVSVAAGMLPSYYVGEGYPRAIARAGGVPFILPGIPGAEIEMAAASLDTMDGLLLAGGTDIHPDSYREAFDPELTHEPDSVRDRFELALVAVARERSLPILGVCRGFQLLNVAYGGSLAQHRPHLSPAAIDSAAAPALHMDGIDVEIDAGTRLSEILDGSASTRVVCIHHQAIGVLGPGLRVVGRATDGTVEAIEDASGAEVLGVLWHPEQMLDSGDTRALYKAFVDQGAAHQ